MKCASVVLDIPTRSLDTPFTYLIPEKLHKQVKVGSLVLVPFSGRVVAGYVTALIHESAQEDSNVDADKLKPIQEAIGKPAFNEVQTSLAFWMARTYAAPLQSVFRLFLPPGQSGAIGKAKKEGFENSIKAVAATPEKWAVLVEDTSDVSATSLTSTNTSEVPKTPKPGKLRKTAFRQQEILEALLQGPQKVAELSALIPGARNALSALVKKGLVKIYKETSHHSFQTETTLSSADAKRPLDLTQGQIEALYAIDCALAQENGHGVLVKGVTGSGKTEVYLEAIEKVRGADKSAIVLIPEISLTAQTVGRFRSRFGDDIAILHSRLTTKEKLQEWLRIKEGRAHVVIGARSALFAPIENLGLIVIDEEHEASYKQDQAPRYVARDVAKKMAELARATVLLGSATPSMEALYNARTKKDWDLALMDERPGVARLPEIHIVDMKHARKETGSTEVFSNDLKQALIETHERKEKAVLLLNRRGFASFMLCTECGCVPQCPHCSTSLTYHERTHELVCHTCARTWPLGFGQHALVCPACGSVYLAAFGIGTQRVEDELASFLPDAPLFRMDADTTKKRGSHEAILEAFDAAEGAVLLGTQMIAKGLDFPDVTLVGVINADTTLKFPDFRAPEKTFNLLEQVAGRAGRGERPGKVYIQTYWPTHTAIKGVAEKDRTAFEASENAARQEAYYPPFSRLGNVVISGTNEGHVKRVVQQFADELSKEIEGLEGWKILGPAACIKAKIKDRHRHHVLIKAPLDADVGDLLLTVNKKIDTKGVSVALDVDAYDML